MSSSQQHHTVTSGAATDDTKTLREFPSEELMSGALEIVLGRGLAACVHPFAAWQRFSVSWRLWIVTAYAATGYVIVLSALLALRSA